MTWTSCFESRQNNLSTPWGDLNKEVSVLVRKQLRDRLDRILLSQLVRTSKNKFWCYVPILCHRVMWCLKLSDVFSSAAGTANLSLQCEPLWLENTLTLPLNSISLGYKQHVPRYEKEGGQQSTSRSW